MRLLRPFLLQRRAPVLPLQLLASPVHRQTVRLYCDKVERPKELNKRITEEPGKKVGPISWFNLGVSGILMGCGLAFYYYARDLKEQALAKERKKALGKAKIGGNFSLLDHHGKPVTHEDFYGKWILLYFGFTHCPDICPDEMEKMAEVVDYLAAHATSLGSVQPLFITVDPKRDGVQEVAEYVKEFHPRLIGLTGTEDMIKDACKSFRVYYSSGPADEDDDYIVDHTIILYLLNPEGEFVDYYGQTKDVPTISSNVMMHMGKWKAEEKRNGSLLARVTG